MQHTSERIRDYWLRHSGQHVIFDWERPPKDADYYRYATPLIPVSRFLGFGIGSTSHMPAGNLS